MRATCRTWDERSLDSTDVSFVEFSPALKLERCWGGTLEGIVEKTPSPARKEKQATSGSDLYSRSALSAAFGVGPTLTLVTHVPVSTNVFLTWLGFVAARRFGR